MKNGSLAVFDEHLRTIAFIELQGGLKLELSPAINERDKVNLLTLVLTANRKGALRKTEEIKEGGVSVNFEGTSKEDPLFYQGVTTELKMAGFNAKLVPSSAKNLLMFLSREFSIEQREKVMGEVANLPLDIEPEAVAALENLIKELKNPKRV